MMIGDSDQRGTTGEGSPFQRRRRILVVDDQPTTLMLVRLLLQELYDVVAVPGVDAALEVAETQPIDAALLDIALGEARSGVDLLHLLRQMPGYEQLPAIACTAYAVVGMRERYLDAGFDDYIGKPFKKQELLQVVRRVLSSGDGPHRSIGRGIMLRIPPPPGTFGEIMHLLSSPEPHLDTDQLVRVLQKDPVASAWVLRHVNSAYYGLRHKITSVDRAVAMLGFDPVCNLVLTEIVTQRFLDLTHPEMRYLYDHIMRVSTGTAAYARSLAQYLTLDQPDAAFTAGLLHQLGRMALLSSDPAGYRRLWSETEDGLPTPPSHDEEVRHYNTDHVRLGADIARSWHLAEDLVTLLRFFEDPQWIASNRLQLLAHTILVGHNATCALLAAREMTDLEPVTRLAQKTGTRTDDLVHFLGRTREHVQTFVHAVAPGEPAP